MNLMTPAELAELLKVPVGTIYRWRTTGEGPPAIRMGKHLRFKRESVLAWLDERTSRRTA